MKKICLIILSIVAVVCMLCLFTACGESGPSDSNSYIKSIESWYETAEDGSKILVLDITYFNDTKETIKTTAPKELVDLSLKTNVFGVIPEGATAPEIRAWAVFADGTTVDLPVTDEMITGGAIDFSTVGTYTLEIEYMGKKISTEVYVRSGIIVNGDFVEADHIVDALTAGGEIKLAGDFKVALTEDLVFDKETVLDLGGFSLDFVGQKYLRVFNKLTVKNGTLTNDTNGFLVGKRAAEGVEAVRGELIIESGTYHCETTVAQATNGTVTIKGGTFSVTPYDGIETDGHRYLMNCYDAGYADETAKVIVEGGTFYNWNPANNAAEGLETNFLADGFMVVTEVVGEDTIYSVAVAEPTPAPVE